MSLEVVEKFVQESGKEELVNAFNSVKEAFESNLSKLSAYERDLKKAIEKRENVKNLVKTKLGLEDLSEASLDKYLETIKDKPDDRLLNENKALNDLLKSLKSEKEVVEKKYIDIQRTYMLEKQLSNLGAMSEVENQRAYEILLNEVKKNIQFSEDGGIFFQSDDGSILRKKDGSPMTLEDIYGSIRESDEFAFLFKSKRSKSGAGAKNNVVGGVGDESKYFDKSSPEFNLTKQAELFISNPALYHKLKG